MEHHAENTRYLVTIRELEREAGFVGIHVCHHEDRYSIEIQFRSLFQDRRASWVRIVNGVEKYVKETTETSEDEETRVLGNLLLTQDVK